MYQPSQFEVLLHLQPVTFERLTRNHLTFRDNTLTFSLVNGEKGFVGIYDSYTLDHCRMVKYAGDTLSHAKAALTMAIQGYNSVMLFMNTRNSSASRITQRQVKWLDSEIKSENKSRAKHEKCPLYVKYCYMELGDHGNKNLLKQETIPSEYLISNGFDRLMMDSTTLDDLDQAITAHSTNMNPKLLVLNITDNTFVNGYLYIIDLQQPFATIYPLSKDFHSLISLLDNIKSKASTSETMQPSCFLTHFLINSLVGNHFAKLFLEMEQSPQDDDIPLVEQSIIFARDISSLQGFAVKNPVRQWFPGVRSTLQDGNLPNKALLERLSILELGIKDLTLENKDLKEAKTLADSQHRQQMEQQAKEKTLLEDSNLSSHYDNQTALKDRADSKIELERSTMRLRMYQEESTQLKKLAEEQTQKIVDLKMSNTELNRHIDQSRTETMMTSKHVTEMNTRLCLLENEKQQHLVALYRYQQKTVILEQAVDELRISLRSSKAAEEEMVTNLIYQIYNQHQDAQSQATDQQEYIDDLNLDLEQLKRRETGLEKNVLQVTGDYLIEMQRCNSYEALFQALFQQINQEIRQGNSDLRIQAQQLEDQRLTNDHQLCQIHQLERERQQLKEDGLAEVQQLKDQHCVKDSRIQQQIQQNAMDKDDHQTALQRQIELLKEATNNLAAEEAIRLQESKDHIMEKAHLLEQVDELTKKGTIWHICIQKMEDEAKTQADVLVKCQGSLKEINAKLEYEKRWAAQISSNAQKDRAVLLQWIALVRKTWAEQVTGPSNNTGSTNPTCLEVFDLKLPASLSKHIPVYSFTQH